MNAAEGLEFWRDLLLKDWAPDCVWQAILPTIMFTAAATWDQVRAQVDLSKDPRLEKSLRLGMRCVQCNACQGGKYCIFAVRVLVAKRKRAHRVRFQCTDGALEMPLDTFHYGYGAVFHSGLMCLACANRNGLPFRLNSNSEMHNMVLDTLTDIARAMQEACGHTDLTGEALCKLVVGAFQEQQQDMLRKLGKIVSRCPHCNAAAPKMRCSGCNYVRYCSAECATPDWPKHKHECKLLKQQPLIYGMEKTKVLFSK